MLFHKLTINRFIFLIYLITIVYFITALLTNDSVKLWGSAIIGTSIYSYLLIMLWKRQRLRPLNGQSQVHSTNLLLECKYESGKFYQMQWADIRRISINILVENDGSHPKVWLRFHSYPWRRVLNIPTNATGFQEIFDKVSQWDNFNTTKYYNVQLAKESQSITLWQKID